MLVSTFEYHRNSRHSTNALTGEFQINIWHKNKIMAKSCLEKANNKYLSPITPIRKFINNTIKGESKQVKKFPGISNWELARYQTAEKTFQCSRAPFSYSDDVLQLIIITHQRRWTRNGNDVVDDVKSVAINIKSREIYAK